MQRRKHKKQKYRPPTVDEFLQFKPKRALDDWSTNDEDLVEIKVPKFKTDFGKSFCRVIKKENQFSAKMDKLGSLIWHNCDGQKTVKDILLIVKKEFSKEENIDQRLFLFLRQLQNLSYINL